MRLFCAYLVRAYRALGGLREGLLGGGEVLKVTLEQAEVAAVLRHARLHLDEEGAVGRCGLTSGATERLAEDGALLAEQPMTS